MQAIFDVQSIADKRNLPVNWAGIKGLRHPITIHDQTTSSVPITHASVAYFDMFVDLPAHQKGTHMSRFVEILNEAPITLSTGAFSNLLDTLITRLEAQNGFLSAKFPFFVQKSAPISGAKSLMDYEVELVATLEAGVLAQKLIVHVPITSLCPCSKKIAAYGAHNQRSVVIAQIWYQGHLSILEIVRSIEAQASCELYALLKRPDEKVVTERAYDNPKFVEDMVRDVARSLQDFGNIDRFIVSSENFESIHNHSAYAQIQWEKA
ncbi:MAG: GTP cyclohydrolase FolE2 [Gammaproteobacteria bacterium]